MEILRSTVKVTVVSADGRQWRGVANISLGSKIRPNMGVFRLKLSRPTEAEKVNLGNIGEIQYSPRFGTDGGHFEANPPLANVHSTFLTDVNIDM